MQEHCGKHRKTALISGRTTRPEPQQNFLVPKMITDELQWVLNATACLISCTSKYDRGLSALLHNELHWRVQYKLAVTVHRCLRNQAPTYLTDYCVPVSNIASRWHLRSTINWLFHVSAAALSVVALSLLLVPQSGIYCLTVCANSCWTRAVSRTQSEKPPVCLLLAFRWQCVRGVLRNRAMQMYIYLLVPHSQYSR